MSRYADCLGNARYIGSVADGVIHDSENANSGCHIEELIASRQAIGFHRIDIALLGGYTPCGMCITATVNNK